MQRVRRLCEGGPTFWYSGCVKFTRYFLEIRKRADRAVILDEWLERAIAKPLREETQADGRIRRWVKIDEMDGCYLRAALLSDGGNGSQCLL
jgi:hypothetical protein